MDESWGEIDYVRHADGKGRRENLGAIWMLFELHIFAFTFYYEDNNDQSSREFPSMTPDWVFVVTSDMRHSGEVERKGEGGVENCEVRTR